MGSEQIPVICLMGTTATGKTDAAAYLSECFDSEIISVDSSLVYTGMDIGTAKPNAKFLQKYPHHLVDIRHPNDTYSVADFYADACSLIAKITAAGKLPILVGGTHFYFSALEKGLSNLPTADVELRAEISKEGEEIGWPALHARLATLDADSAARIDPMDAQRIQRALEIVIQSGQSVAAHNSQRKPAIANPMVKIALTYSDRGYLRERIAQRFELMLQAGLQTEVEGLLNEGVSADAPAMKMIGYRQMLDFLQGDLSYDEMTNKGIVATRQLAKRQLTWLRNQSNVVWWVDDGLKTKNFVNLEQFVSYFVT